MRSLDALDERAMALLLICRVPNASKKKVPMEIVVNMTFNGKEHTTTATALYSSKAGKGGKFIQKK
jgi:hypothetical protein